MNTQNAPMKKPKQAGAFMMQLVFNYSDDSGQGLEHRFAHDQDYTYDEFMQACDKAYGLAD